MKHNLSKLGKRNEDRIQLWFRYFNHRINFVNSAKIQYFTCLLFGLGKFSVQLVKKRTQQDKGKVMIRAKRQTLPARVSLIGVVENVDDNPSGVNLAVLPIEDSYFLRLMI